MYNYRENLLYLSSIAKYLVLAEDVWNPFVGVTFLQVKKKLSSSGVTQTGAKGWSKITNI